MAKLFFRYSTMNAGKSIDLLRCNHNYIENGEKTICLTSGKDNRYGKSKITSRIGISTDAISIYDDTNIFDLIKDMKIKLSCIFVDEVQFLTEKHVFQLSDIVDVLNIPVICYGLRSDFVLQPFEGSKYLMAIADNVEEIKTICNHCKKKKAIVNARYSTVKGTVGHVKHILTEGEQVQVGGNETYVPLCRKCFKELLELTKKIYNKDTSIIPEGPYCYNETTCPYYDHIKDADRQSNGYCHYLEIGDEELNSTVVLEDMKTGEKNTADELGLPIGGLLFDMCKECGINDNNIGYD